MHKNECIRHTYECNNELLDCCNQLLQFRIGPGVKQEGSSSNVEFFPNTMVEAVD